VALLDQHREFDNAASVWDAAASGYGDVMEVGRKVDELALWLEDLGGNATEADAARYSRALEQYTHLGGYDFHTRVNAVLQGLGFNPDEAKGRPLATLSGGERGRVGLAAQLAAPADLRLFDEPTNHLDLDTTRWLANYLSDLGETVMVISHDRAFLDETVGRVLHVHAGTAASYRGSYSEFVQQREERDLTERRSATKQQAFIRKEEEYIRRNIAGQKTKQAQSRRRKLARMPRLSAPPGDEQSMVMRLETGERGGDRVVDIEHLDVRIGTRKLLEDVCVTARRGDVIALLGANGAGKTTLLATILGAHDPAGGEVRLGASITPAWYRQDLAGVPLDRKIFDIIYDLRPQWNRGQVQGHLGAFQFSGDEVLRITNSLSGGERSRVALAMITLARANLLVLDEPTNHLDVEGIEVFEDAIESYKGTVILVSHDRAFLRELATRVWVIADGKLEDYDAPFVDWDVKQEERARALEASLSAASDMQPAPTKRRPPKPPDPARQRRNALNVVQAAEREVEKAETAVAVLEAELADGDLYDGTAEGNLRAAELGRALEKARVGLDEALAAWSDAVEVFDSLKE
jgi:ATP-binding cassette subfamily F protein 3